MMDAYNDLVASLFSRRHNIQRPVREVDKRRQSELKDFSFPDVVFIATFGNLSHISKYTPTSIKQARECNHEFSFFENWQKYCKALQEPSRTLAIYGEVPK